MYNVLIVEDEMLVRLGLKNSIEWSKHNMAVIGDVSNGKAALDFYKKNRPDIIITDIKMPLMDGLELIEKIREEDDRTKIIILSSLEEFNTVRKAISLGVSDYIAKLTMTEEEIDSILSKISKEMRDQEKRKEKDSLAKTDIDVVKDRLLKDFLFSHVYSSEDFAERIKALGLCLSSEHMILTVLEIDHYDRLKAYLEDDKGSLTNYALMNLINELLKRFVKGEVFYDEGPRYILIFNTDIEDNITNIMENIKNSLNIYFNTNVSFGLSNMLNGFTSLKEMYFQAIKALDAKFIQGNGIFSVNDEIDTQAIMLEKLAALYEFYDLLNIQDEVNKEEYSRKVQLMLPNMPNEKDQIKDTLCQFLHWIANNMHLSGEEIYEILSTYEDNIKKSETLEEVIDFIKEFIFALRNSMKAKNIMSKEVAKAIKFIKENYSKELSLQEVAEKVNLSPSYFSSVFKKELRVNYIEYLNDIRIEKAKELLRDTSLKSYEIAEKVGFKESTYFSMLFKKTTKLSPNKFRQIWQKNWKGDYEDENT